MSAVSLPELMVIQMHLKVLTGRVLMIEQQLNGVVRAIGDKNLRTIVRGEIQGQRDQIGQLRDEATRVLKVLCDDVPGLRDRLAAAALP